MSMHGMRLLLLAAIVAAAAPSCSSCRHHLKVSEPVYREAVSAFYTGVAALQTSQEPLAREKFERVTTLVPGEPAAWANLGLLFVRQGEFDPALRHLERAATLAPDEAAIASLRALAESRKGNPPEAIRHWKRALDLDPGDLRSAFALAQETARQGGDQNEAEAQRILAGIVSRSGNLAARLELARLAAKRADRKALLEAVAPLAGAAKHWPPEAREQLSALQQAIGGDPRAAATRATFLKNVLQRVPEYRLAYAALSTPLEAVGEPILRLIALENPDPRPAPADEALAFTLHRGPEEAAWVGAVPARTEGPPVVATASAAGIVLGGRPVRSATGGVAGLAGRGTSSGTVLAVDVNNDFLTDLVVADARGLRVLRQEAGGGFNDITMGTALPAGIRESPAAATWGADLDLDGDLDLVLAPVTGPPIALRNNNDGTFSPLSPFSGVGILRGFCWADVDGDAVPDAALLDDAGAVRVLVNQRGLTFAERGVSPGVGPVAAIAVADISGASAFDLVLVSTAGRIARMALTDGRPRVENVLTIDRPPEGLAAGDGRLVVADLDNNGAADLIVAGPRSSRVVLAGPSGSFHLLPQAVDMTVTAAADLDGDGRLELVGLSGSRPARATSRGARRYHWQVFRPRAASAEGDQRINSFGIGGEVEIRTGLHAQKQPIASPLVHFGLGEATRTDVVRIVWPNGVLQSEFDRDADATVVATQRLKGSCPWLFAWDGRAMAFVTDLIWRSPLGLRINAQDTADVLMTEDRVRITGDRLAARHGVYDLRITAELWETHFFDTVALLVADHPAGTELYVDERFAVPAPRLEPIATTPVQPFAIVRDDRGVDVSRVVRDRDDRHLDFAGRGAYQGITRDHFVELELPAAAPRRGPLWLVAQGWIHPTDSSVNIAISQGAHEQPRGLSLWVADAKGRFHEVRSKLGFPAGKDKTVLLDLAGVFRAGDRRRLRLATNLEIYWDRLGWAAGRPDAKVEVQRLALAGAELWFRGYSPTVPHDASSPERPRYAVAGTAPRWLDLEGFYTRFGDVLPLLTAVDDRYVIMNAGDELRLRFREAPAPAPDRVRDFVAIADGWVKDGDFNTTASRTVLPLPTHASARYDARAGRLEDDPVYRLHPQDFVEYHTRYATPARARDALRVATDDQP